MVAFTVETILRTFKYIKIGNNSSKSPQHYFQSTTTNLLKVFKDENVSKQPTLLKYYYIDT